MATQWRTGDGAPYWRDAHIRPAQIIHAAQIPTAHTPWLHKTPGGKKGKKDNRLTPQPPSAAAPLAKGSYGAFILLPLFTTGSVFGRTPP